MTDIYTKTDLRADQIDHANREIIRLGRQYQELAAIERRARLDKINVAAKLGEMVQYLVRLRGEK